MRTVRSSSHVYTSMHWAGFGVSEHELGGGGCIPACTGKGGGSAEGVYSSMHCSLEQNDWQTGVKTLPLGNFVCGQ